MKNKKLVLVFALVAVLVASVMICSFIAFAEDNDVTVAKLGDVDGNGTVGAEDVVAFSQYFANYDYDNPTTDERMIAVADLSGDGKVTLVDLQMLRVGLANGYFDEPEGCAHEWADATCETPKTCSICGETEGEALGHDMVTDAAVDPSCTATGLTEGAHCSRCDGATTAQTVVDALGHAWGEEDANGSKICNLCGEVETKDAAEVYFFLNAINWDNEYLAGKSFNQPLVFSKDYEGYPNDLGYVPTDSSHPGLLYIQGWGGSNYEAEGIVYRVVDANGEALTEWTPLAQHNTYPTLSAATDGVLTNVQNKIPDGYAYYFRGYADVTAFSEEYVTVEVAFVLKGSSKNDEHFEFLTVKDVLYNRPVAFNISSIGGKAQTVKAPNTAFNTAISTSSSAGYNGMLYFYGWGGTHGEATGIKYRVVDKNGKVVQDWRDLAQWGAYEIWSTNTANLATMKEMNAGVTHGYNVRGKIDLSAFPEATVTVEIAFVMKEGKQLLTFARATNVTNIEKRPVYFNATFSNSVGALSNGTVMEKTGVSTTAGRGGLLYFYGWGGTIGEIDYDAETSTGGVKYRVVDANGEVLEDWQYLSVPYVGSAGNEYPICVANTANLATVQGKIPAATHAYTVRGWVDLTDYVGSTVTVEFAYVLKNAPADYELLHWYAPSGC